MDSLVTDDELSLGEVAITKGLLHKARSPTFGFLQVQDWAHLILFLWSHPILPLTFRLVVAVVLPIIERSFRDKS